MDNQIKIANEALDEALAPLLDCDPSTQEKIQAVQSVLEGSKGEFWRKELGNWTMRVVPVELLVPEVHRAWRPLVSESVKFVVSRLSSVRLAPKIIEQISLAPDTPAELRLLRFIARVPGLQKIGQLLARNRTLNPQLRRALIQLENGISDVKVAEVHAIIRKQLQSQIQTFVVRLKPKILSEASVSAVVAFTWRNPASDRRERGVFKVLKPHIPECYAEDMRILAQLARHVARKRRGEGARLGRFTETLTEIRLLLQREVDFPREQATLAGALKNYRTLPGIRIPRLIGQLSTNTITALTFEKGRKVTEVRQLPSDLRKSIAARLVKTLLAIPALSPEEKSIFHADPHAGNLLYDKHADEVVILDWALTERLTRGERRNVVLLVLMMILRDSDGMARAIGGLCKIRDDDTEQLSQIRKHVDRFLDELPLTRFPGPMDAMGLLEELALQGTWFPPALLMFRKATFTLDGVVEDIAGSRVRLDSLMARYAITHWNDTVKSLFGVLSFRDWMKLEWSALTFTPRASARPMLRPWQRLLEKAAAQTA